MVIFFETTFCRFSETKKGSEIFSISLPQNRFFDSKNAMSSIKLDFLGLWKPPSKTAESLDFTGFVAMSSILITHPMTMGEKVCRMKLVAPWRGVFFKKVLLLVSLNIVETKKSGMGVYSCHSRFFSFHYVIMLTFSYCVLNNSNKILISHILDIFRPITWLIYFLIKVLGLTLISNFS